MKNLFILIFFFLFLPLFILSQEKIDINTASLERLELLTGIGPAYAQRIIDNRPFSSIDGLIRVNGIGEKTLQKIKDQGLAFVNNQPIENEIATDATDQENLEEQPMPYPAGVIFNKIMPSPEGADSLNEYIEIRNTNDFEIDLSNWSIKDKRGSSKEYVLGEKIPALSVLTLFRPQTQITLNNEGDGLELLNPSKEIMDTVDFGKAQTGVAFVRTAYGWQWDVPEQETVIAAKENSDISGAIEAQQPETNKKTEIDLFPDSRGSEKSIYLTGLIVALSSSTAFLFIKKHISA